jgi:hypothetical protein
MGLHAEILASEWIRDVEQWRVRAARASLHIFKTEWSASSRRLACDGLQTLASPGIDARLTGGGRLPPARGSAALLAHDGAAGRATGREVLRHDEGFVHRLDKATQLCATCDFVKSLAKALLGKG